MAKKSDQRKIFSALEVGHLCSVVNQTAINWIKGGHLKGFTTPGGQFRVYADDLVEFLNKRSMRIPDELSNIIARQGPPGFLIIDDDRELNTLIAARIRSAFPDSKVEQAFDGFEAGTTLARSKPNVVILDLNLPGVNGKTICRNIKTDPELGKPFVLAISGLDDPEERTAILNEGAEGFFSKPLDMQELLEVINTCVVDK